MGKLTYRFENLKVVSKCKAQGTHQGTGELPYLVSILAGMKLISKHGCVRNVILTCFCKLNISLRSSPIGSAENAVPAVA